jgi:hypothetical protein
MLAQQFRDITNAAKQYYLQNRPTQLKGEVLDRMKLLAEQGKDHIEYCFNDEPEVVKEAIKLIVQEGFRHARSSCGVTRFEW